MFVLALGSLLLLVALLAVVAFAAKRFAMHPEVARKAVHVGLGLYCLTLPWLFDRAWPVAAVCAASVALLLALRLSKASRLAAGLHGVARDSYGEVLFAISIGLLFALGHRDPVTYVVPIAILTLSDAAAALVGVRYGRATFQIEDGTKSLEGAAIFFLTAWIIAMVLLLLLSDAPRLTVIVLGVEIAAYGTLVEGTSWRGWDNFFLPVAIHLVLAHSLDAPSSVLLRGAVLGIGAVAGALALGARIGLDRHAAVFVATLLATIGFASSSWNVVVPAFALGCHLVVRRPVSSSNPHLTLGLVFVMLALVWYLVSEWTGHATIFAFNTSFAALGVALLAAGGRVWPAIACVPIGWAMVEARGLVPGASTPSDPRSLAELMAVLLIVALMAAFARLRWRPVASEGIGALALAAGAIVFPLAQR